MSTQIRIELQVKSDLETYRDIILKKGTHSDAICSLMEVRVSSERNIDRLKGELASEKERRGLEDLTLGEKRKKAIVTLQQELGLRNPNDLIDFLVEHYHNSPQLDKATFVFYGELLKHGK